MPISDRQHLVRGVYLATCLLVSSISSADYQNRTVLYHRETVWNVAISPDDKIIASCDGLGLVRLWEGATGRPWGTLAGHRDAVYGLAFSPDGKLLATGGVDNSIRIWSVYTGKRVAQLEPDSWSVISLRFHSNQRLASAHANGAIRVWDLTNQREIGKFEWHRGRARGCVFSKDGSHLFSVGEDGFLKKHNFQSGKVVNQVEVVGEIRSIDISPSGDEIAVGTTSRSVLRFDTQELNRIEEVRVLGGCHSIAYSRDGKRLGYSYYSDAQIGVSIRDLDAGRATQTCNETLLKTKVTGLAFGNNDQVLAVPGHDGCLRLLSVSPDGSLGPVPIHETRPRAENRREVVVAELANGDWVAGDRTNHVTLYSKNGSKRTISYGAECYAIAGTNDGRVVVGGRDDVKVYDSGLTKRLEKLPRDNSVFILAASPTSPVVAWGTAEGTLDVWRLTKPAKRIEQLKRRGREITGLTFSNDGKLLAYSTDKGFAYVLEVENEFRQVATARLAERQPIYGLCFCDRLGQLIIGAGDGSIHQLSLATGRTERIPSIDGGINRMESIPGTTLVVLARTMTKKATRFEFWDMESRELVSDAFVPDTWLQSFVIAGDDDRLLAGSLDGRVAQWDLNELFQTRNVPRVGEFLGLPPAAIDISEDLAAQLPTHLRRLGEIEQTEQIPPLVRQIIAARNRSDYESTLNMSKQVVGLARSSREDATRTFGAHLQNLAGEYAAQGRFEEAIAQLSLANHFIDVNDKPDTAMAGNLEELAFAHQRLGRHQQASRFIELAVQQRKAIFDEVKKIDLRAVRRTIQGVRREDWDRIPTQWQQIVSAGRDSTLCLTQSMVLHDLVTLAETEFALGRDIEETLAAADQAVAELKQLAGDKPDLLEVANIESGEAKIYRLRAASAFNSGDMEKAATNLKQAVAILRAKFGTTDLVASFLRDLAVTEVTSNQLEAAESSIDLSIAINDNIFGDSHVQTLRSRAVLAELRLAQQRHDEAIDVAKAVSSEFNRSGLPRNFETLRAEVVWGTAACQLQRWDQAVTVWRSAMTDATSFLREEAIALPDSQFFAFAERFQTEFFNEAVVALWPGRDEPGVAKLLAELLINCKGLSVQLLAEKAKASHSSGAFEMQTLAAELTRVRSRLAGEFVSGKHLSTEALRKSELDDLFQQERQLSAEVGRLAGALGEEDQWIHLSDLLDALPTDAVFVSMLHASYTKRGAKQRSLDSWIAAVIGAESGEEPSTVQILDLGPTSHIEELARSYRKATADSA